MSTDLLAIGNLSPGQNLDSYIQTVSRIPILSAVEEKGLAEKC
jgi:RNA polymerase sigma-32 factor